MNKTIYQYKKQITNLSLEFINKAIKIISYRDEILSKSTIDRYISINNAIFLPLELYTYEESHYQFEDLHMFFGDLDRLILCWVALGSAVESSLQVFLTVFKNDYDDNPCNKWMNFDRESVQSYIFKSINELVDDNYLNSKQKERIKDFIKKEMKYRENGRYIEDLSMCDLINYFVNNVFDNKGVKQSLFKQSLDLIRQNRNIIHTFKDREIMGWNEFQESLDTYIFLLEKLSERIYYLELAINNGEYDYS